MVETGHPLRDPAALMRLFGERLDSLRDPLDPGFGFDLIRLMIPSVEPLHPRQLGFNESPVPAEAVTALIDRLGARMGPQRLRRALARDSHAPEQAATIAPATEARSSRAPWPTADPGEPPLRPIHLFDPPQPIEVTAEVPDGAPRRFRWRQQAYDVVYSEGPERIAASWWRRWRSEGLTRDYYRVEDATGHRFWLFRAGLFGEEAQHPRWYLHGLFA
jgi:protein ImuB